MVRSGNKQAAAADTHARGGAPEVDPFLAYLGGYKLYLDLLLDAPAPTVRLGDSATEALIL